MTATANPTNRPANPIRPGQAINDCKPAMARLATLLLTLPLGAAVLSGCVSRPVREARLVDQPSSVSAREYGFVRPALVPQTDPGGHALILAESQSISHSARGRTASASLSGDPWERIRNGSDFGIAPHPRTTQSLNRLAKNKRYLNQLASRAQPYLHLIVTELERSGLPTGLALLPEIESRYNPRAVSPMSAAGMWQFMPLTGKSMGLEQNAWYDGRYDVLASTRGAIRYLKELNQTFDGDWALTLAAYNAGPARVQGAQRANERAGKATDYWSLDLPLETREYVPKLLAVAALVQSPQRHGQQLPALPASSPLTAVATQQPVHLAAAATASGLSTATLKRLNPALKQGRNRAGQTTYLLVPSEAALRLQQHLQQLGTDATGALAAADQRPEDRS